MTREHAELPGVGEVPAHPEVWCDDPFNWWGPFADNSASLRCALGKGHTNDHMAVFGSEDHPDADCTVEVRWSRRTSSEEDK